MARSSRSSESISAPCHVRHGPSTRLITPQLAVTLGPGRPSAITSSPTLGGVSARRLAVGRLWPASFKTARSVLGSRPATLAKTNHGAEMKLTIVAATGGIGRQILHQAIAAGHDVTAVVRNATQLSGAIRIVTADLAGPDPAALESAVAGADAVLSGLGPRSKPDAGIASRGTRAIVRAMQATGVRRIVVVSAAPVSTVASPGRPSPPRHDPGDGFLMRYVLSPMIKVALRPLYADLALMEDILRASGLDWTVV